ncbi:MAG: HAD hydrolase family protein [Saccharofermentans sp.]|nr:HAD hydrolase family protein [Saccharofermentans sp.]
MDIKILVMDVDGTLTDGKIYMGDNGELCKAFNIKDGYGIHDILIPANIIPVIITGRESMIVKNRCYELDISEVYQGIKDKKEKLIDIANKYNIELKEVAYIGDDINDLSCMEEIKRAGGVIACPADASKQIINLSDYVSEYRGGEGAVRDFIEWIISN